MDMSSSTTTATSANVTTSNSSKAPYYYGELIKKESTTVPLATSTTNNTTTTIAAAATNNISVTVTSDGGCGGGGVGSLSYANSSSGIVYPSTTTNSAQQSSSTAISSSVCGGNNNYSTTTTTTTTAATAYSPTIQANNNSSNNHHNVTTTTTISNTSPTSSSSAYGCPSTIIGNNHQQLSTISTFLDQQNLLTNSNISPSTSLSSLNTNHHRLNSSSYVHHQTAVPTDHRSVLIGSPSSSSSSHYGHLVNSGYLNRPLYNQHNTIGIGSFANPLLSIEADTRNGTESLPRAFQPPYQSNKKPFYKSNNNKQSIYQKSLSIFTNGVSPLLRKKKSNKSQNPELDSELKFGLSNHQNLSSSTLGLSRLRRKSEPIMFSYDSITNELSKFQAREEKIVKNINLDFEKMLMNDTNGGEYSGQQQQHQISAAAIAGASSSSAAAALMNAQNEASLRRMKLANIHQHFTNNNNNNNSSGNRAMKDDYDPYGKTIASTTASSTAHLAQQQQTLPSQQQQQTPTSHPQLSYKEPFYMVYEDNRQSANKHLHHHHHHHNSSNDNDNIYEEIDFLTLSSLRAQYADTLSLQSYKKKGGSKRSLASSSFTRWFSTRKKNSPSMSEDENPYIDIKLKKQRPPITLPEPPPDLSKEQLKRRYIVGSIVDSENSYINSLQRIINHYKKPLEESSPSILSQNKINIIFHRLEQILQCHTIFGIALSQCVREWDEKEQIGDVFIASFSKSMVLDIYSDFINNFTNAMETARKSAKSKSAFAQFLQEKSLSSPDRLSFFGLMVKPVQRFPQFILLLSDLLKHTPSDHHDRMSLQLALTQLESLADRLNERKRDAERHFAVKQLLKDYLSSSTTNSSNRFLLRQDDIYQLELDTSSGLVMKTKCRKLYLLNDMLVCVSVPANRLKYAVSLQDVDVMDDVTPATNNLIANSMLKSKDSASTSSSPKHCTVERMYCDLNSLFHDLEVISRVSNLLSSLRYQYNGLSVELVQQIGAEIREEIRKKDAQITLIDRSCLQIRIRSKNYKDIICIQMNDPEIKKDWLTDVRLAKLALDRANNPAWDIVNETISATRTNLSNSIIMHRVPLFVKSLPIFATTEHSMLTCALHYRIHRRDDLVLESNSGVLWICNVNENGSQLGALATNGTDISLIHSYELCDSHVTCIESVGSYAVWIGLRQGRIIVIDASSPGEWQQFAALDVSAEVTCIRYFGNFVYVGLITGVVALFNATHYEEPIIVSLCASHPVTCLLPVNKEMFACCGEKIWIINNTQLDRSYYLHNKNATSPINDLSPETKATATTNHFVLDEDLKPNLLAHCGIGLWVSLINSSIIKLYHTETFKHLQDVNVASNVKRILNEMVDPNGIFVTAMLATRGLLWIGTNVGVIVTLNLPRLQGVPLISGCLNVALHRHTGPVTILLNLTNTQSDIPIHPNNSTTADKNKTIDDIEKDMELKSEEVESIYGLYSDLMNVENYVRVGQHGHDKLSKMTWELANINLSDDSTSESAIYQDGGMILRKKPPPGQAINKRRTLGNEHFSTNRPGGTEILNYPGSNQLSPAKSQNSIYDSSGGNDKSQNERERDVSSSSGIGASSSLYDITSFKGMAGQLKLNDPGSLHQQQLAMAKYKYSDTIRSTQRNQFDSNNNSSMNNNNKTALLMTGGNGYKRVTMSETTYSSQHAHCCIWEYKL